MKTTTVITELILLTTQCVVGQVRRERTCYDEVVQHLTSLRDTIYIEKRSHLEKVAGLRTKGNTATLYGTTSSGQTISFVLRLGPFDSRHLIPTKQVYGKDGGLPSLEVREFDVNWNGVRLRIPKESFANLYEFHLPSIETYVSRTMGCLYVYVSASDGAGSYSVKFVFNKTGFVTRLISTNECTDGFDCVDGIPTRCNE
jgi:hypothetical protein